MKKILALLLIGGLAMTTLTGCKDMIFGKSKDEIEDLFVDFMSVFQSENYDFLYEKEGYTENLPEGDKGCWVLSTYMDTYDDKGSNSVAIQLVFNKNINQCRGYFIKNYEDKYPVRYEDGEITFIDNNTDAKTKEELESFWLLFDILSVDKSYLKTLKGKRHYYNFEVPLYGADYYLPVDDINRIALKKYYPEFPYHDVDEVFLELVGKGSIPWNTTSSPRLSIYYKTETGGNSFTASIGFKGIEFFSELFEEE